MTVEIGRLHGERIDALVQAKLDSLLEGYELHGVQLDEQLTQDTVNEIMGHRAILLASSKQSAGSGVMNIGTAGASAFVHAVEQHVRISFNSIKVQVERRMLMPKKAADAQLNITNVYHVHGHNPRWNVNSEDRSVNLVTTSSEQIFASLRQEITSGVPAGEEQKDILERLAAMEQAQASPSFAQRYSEFIGSAANHITLLAPFIPALTEILHRTLST